MTDKKKELTENEKRVEGVIAGEGAHVDELQIEEKDRQEHVAGDISETKPAKENKKEVDHTPTKSITTPAKK